MRARALTPFSSFVEEEGRHLHDCQDAEQPTSTRQDRGATLVEYGLLIALIAMTAFAAVMFLGGESSGSLDKSASQVSSAMG